MNMYCAVSGVSDLGVVENTPLYDNLSSFCMSSVPGRMLLPLFDKGPTTIKPSLAGRCCTSMSMLAWQRCPKLYLSIAEPVWMLNACASL